VRNIWKEITRPTLASPDNFPNYARPILHLFIPCPPISAILHVRRHLLLGDPALGTIRPARTKGGIGLVGFFADVIGVYPTFAKVATTQYPSVPASFFLVLDRLSAGTYSNFPCPDRPRLLLQHSSLRCSPLILVDPVRDISKRQENPFRKHSRTRDANISASTRNRTSIARNSHPISARYQSSISRGSLSNPASVLCIRHCVRLDNYVKECTLASPRMHYR